MTFQQALRSYLQAKLTEKTRDKAIIALKGIFVKVVPSLISGQDGVAKGNLTDEEHQLAILMLEFLREKGIKGPNAYEMLKPIEPLILDILKD